MISMEVFMDIFALHRQGLKVRAIARRLGKHRETVKKYLEAGTIPQYRKVSRKESILAPYRQLIEDWLEEDTYRATWIHDRIKQLGYGGSYDTVKSHVRKIKERKSRQAFIRFETVPGLQAQVDWGDFQVINSGSQTLTVYLFVMVLGFSRAIYAEFVPRCSLETFMDAHIHAFRYMGGVPLEVLYDNMKHVVICRSGAKVDFNIEFLHFSHHYGFKPVACPPYSPWVKGKVERPMDYIRERFWRGYGFRSLKQANEDLLTWLNETANERVHGTHHERVRVRWDQERDHLSKCPPMDYDTSIKVFRKVYKDCQISYNANRYVLPHRVVGKTVLLKIKDGTIRFYYDDQLLATYPEPQDKGHLMANPLFYDQLRRDAEQRKRKYGRNKGKATRGLMDSSLFPQVLYRPLSDYDCFAQGGEPWTN